MSSVIEASHSSPPAPPSERCLTAGVPGTMKWYGWGSEGQGFDPVGRPGLWPYARRHLGIDGDRPARPPVPLERLALPPVHANPGFSAGLDAILGSDGWSQSAADRVLNAFGKSTRDLWRLRHGRVPYAPDYVLFPDSEAQILAIVALADRHRVALVPFGGGSNVAGCLEVQQDDGRAVAAVNLRRYNRVLAIDRVSGTARVESGILGPELERVLNAEGLTLGHMPDSFPFSTLGGWVATRSSGMLSDGYGNIEDMVLSLRMATPAGTVTTRDVPHASNGPDANRLCIGSEGALGIITEVTVCVRPNPPAREFRGYLFPSFEAGIEAMRQCQHAGAMPALTRLNDPMKTQLSAAFHRKSTGLKALLSAAFKAYLRRLRGVRFDSVCLLIAAFEGDDRMRAFQRRAVEGIYRRHGGIAVGRGPGESFAEGKFDFPYIRDFLMDKDVLVDVAETSTVWRTIVPLYRDAMRVLEDGLGAGGRHRWVGCHVSHSYPAGASLYFSFAMTCRDGADGPAEPWGEMEHFFAVKRAALDCFAAHGATLSHHHAVGNDHLPWLLAESPVAGGTVVDAVKATLDPNGIMNPGKLVRPRAPLLREAGQ
jgi:alkyldihydroxyacetonephosphate synthase